MCRLHSCAAVEFHAGVVHLSPQSSVALYNACTALALGIAHHVSLLNVGGESGLPISRWIHGALNDTHPRVARCVRGKRAWTIAASLDGGIDTRMGGADLTPELDPHTIDTEEQVEICLRTIQVSGEHARTGHRHSW